jgi:acyl-homoserine lactone acylase PvdQ
MRPRLAPRRRARERSFSDRFRSCVRTSPGRFARRPPACDRSEPCTYVEFTYADADGPSLLGFGDAWVLLVDFAEPVTGWSVLAYGQTTNPDSRHSADQIRIFAAHDLRRAWYTEAEIKEHTTREYRPARR